MGSAIDRLQKRLYGAAESAAPVNNTDRGSAIDRVQNMVYRNAPYTVQKERSYAARAAAKEQEPQKKQEDPGFLERVGSTAKGVLQRQATGYAGAAESALELTRRMDTLASTGYQRAQQERKNAAHYRDMLQRGTLDDGTVIDGAMRARLERMAELSEKRAAIGQKGTEEVHKPITGLIDKADAYGDRMSAGAAENFNRAKQGAGTAGRIAVDLAGALGDVAADAGANLLLPGLGTAARVARTYGHGAEAAEDKGAGVGRQALYGAGSAALGEGINRLFGGNPILEKAAGKGALDDLLLPNLGKTLPGRMVKSGLGEAIEEGAESMADPFLQQAALGKEQADPLDWKEVGYDALIGGLVGGLTGISKPKFVQEAEDIMPKLDPGTQGISEQKKAAPQTGAVNENGLNAFSEQERVNLSSGKKNKVISTFSEAVSFVKNALSNKQNVDRAYLGKVPDSVAHMIQQETGLDIRGFGVMMNGNDIRHIIKNHGDVLVEQARGQVAVIADDIAQIPEILAAPDRVYLSDETDTKGRKTLVFEKRIGDKYISIQGVSDGKRVLQTDTLYISKGRPRTTRDTMPGTESAVPVINAQGEPPQKSSSIDFTVPQSAENVNSVDPLLRLILGGKRVDRSGVSSGEEIPDIMPKLDPGTQGISGQKKTPQDTVSDADAHAQAPNSNVQNVPPQGSFSAFTIPQGEEKVNFANKNKGTSSKLDTAVGAAPNSTPEALEPVPFTDNIPESKQNVNAENSAPLSWAGGEELRAGFQDQTTASEAYAMSVADLVKNIKPDLKMPTLDDVDTVAPVRAGRVTTIKRPYQGVKPVQTQKNTAAIPVDSGSVERARSRINIARLLAGTVPGKGFKAKLKETYRSVFKPARGVPVDGMTFDGKPYTVDINSNVPGKVISDTNLTAEKLALLDILPQIVQNGEYVGSGEYVQHSSKKKLTIRFDYFETPVVINGKPYVAAFDVEVFPNTNNYRTHRLEKIELSPVANADVGPAPTASATETAPVEGTRPLNSDFTIPQGAENVNSVDPLLKRMMDGERVDRSGVSSGEEIPDIMPKLTGDERSTEKTRPSEIENVKQMLAEEGDNLPDVPEDLSFAKQLQSKGIGYGKDLARNLDAAAGNNPILRRKLRDVFERPLARAKAGYAAEVRSRVNDLKNTMDALGIKAGSRESAAVQWIGEGKRQDPYGNLQDYTIEQLKQDFPESWENILKAEQYFRREYDAYIDRINASLTAIYPNAEKAAQEKLHKLRGTERYYREQAALMRYVAENVRNEIRTLQDTPAAEGNGRTERELSYKQQKLEEYQKKAGEYQEVADRAGHTAASVEQNLLNGDVLRNKRLRPRQDYFHHFQEMESGFKGLVTLLSTPADIDAKLAGQSDFTQPKSKWAGFLQQRTGGAYVEDAVGGMLKYIPAAEYKIAIDPQIARGRALIKGMAEATEDTRNANKFIEWYMDYVNDLAGKTNPIDRPVQKLVGRKAMGALRWLNSRVKSNAIVGNMRSAVSQFFNLPNAAAYIKHPVSWGKGLKLYTDALMHRNGARDVMEQSGFLNERYLDDVFAQFDEGILKAPEKFADWMLSFGDKQTAKLIWATAYSDAVRKGTADPVSYADDLTRRSVAGRGIGEVPLAQKSQLVQLVAPFQVEVNNTWQLMKEKVKRKDALGLLSIFVGNFLMNTITRELFGFDVSYDPINALLESLENSSDDEEEKPFGKALRILGRQGGELLNAMPGGSMLTSYVIPDEADREQLFGEGDPTRFGTGNIGLNMLLKPAISAARGQDFSDDLLSTALNIGLPWGGKQVERVVNGSQDMGWLPELHISLDDGLDISKTVGSYSGSGLLRFPIDTKDPLNVAKGLALGTFSTNEGKNYLEEGASPLPERYTEVYQKMMADHAKDVDGTVLYDTIQNIRSVQKSNEKLLALDRSSGLDDQQKWELYTGVIADPDSKRPEQFRAMMEEGMDWHQITEAYLEYRRLSESEISSSEKATRFAAYLDSSGLNEDQSAVVSDALKFYSQIPAEAKRYESFTSAGLTADTAEDLTVALSSLKPEAGEEEVSNQQRYETVVRYGGLTEEEQLTALESMMEDYEFEKLETAYAAGISPTKYLEFKRATNDLSADKVNGKTVSGSKKAKVLAAIDAMDISDSQKTALYYAAGYTESTLDDAPWISGSSVGRSRDEAIWLLQGGGSQSNDVAMPQLTDENGEIWNPFAQKRHDITMPRL